MITLAKAVPRGLAAVVAAVRQFALPFACFSISGLLIMEVVRTITVRAADSSHGYASSALWGALIFAAALVVVLCAGAFALTRVAPNSDIPFYAIASAAPAALVACVFWLMLTGLSLALWPLDYGLNRIGIRVAPPGFGSLQLVNIGFVLCFLTAITILVLLSGGFSQTLPTRGLNLPPGWSPPPPDWTPPLGWKPGWPMPPNWQQLWPDDKPHQGLIYTGFVWAICGAAALHRLNS